MTLHPLYQISPPLYCCHHNLSTDIIPNCVWHHALLMYVIICTIYNIISTPYVLTLLYLWHHNFYIWNHIQYIGQHIHYTCDITATNLCHHTHCIDIITPTLFMTSHSPYVWHFALYKTSHPHFMTSNHLLYDITLTISDFVSTVSVSLHPQFDDITLTLFMRSHPLYITTSSPLYTTWQPLDLCHHTHSFNDITPFVWMTSHTLFI